MLKRVLEPEVMDTSDDARDYDAMDHVDVNATFCDDVLAFGPIVGTVLDIGTGTARIPIGLCERDPNVVVTAVDLAESMLRLAKENVAVKGFTRRITLVRADAKKLPFDGDAFGMSISNSIIHHIPDPTPAVAEMWRVTANGGKLFIRDLCRPDSEERLRAIATQHGPRASSVDAKSFAHQDALFRASLAAALSLDEVRAIVKSVGLPNADVDMTSDRHWTLRCIKR